MKPHQSILREIGRNNLDPTVPHVAGHGTLIPKHQQQVSEARPTVEEKTSASSTDISLDENSKAHSKSASEEISSPATNKKKTKKKSSTS